MRIGIGINMRLAIDDKKYYLKLADISKYFCFTDIKKLPSVVLEDIFFEINAELMSRDTKWVEENIK